MFSDINRFEAFFGLHLTICWLLATAIKNLLTDQFVLVAFLITGIATIPLCSMLAEIIASKSERPTLFSKEQNHE